MGSIAFQLMVITIISKFTGLFREVFFGAVFGTSIIKDIYVITNSLTAILFSYLFVSTQTTFIPMYNNVLSKKNRKAADHFTANLTNTLVLLAGLVILLTWIFADPLARIIAPGFSPENIAKTADFLRIVVVGILFSAINAAPISYLNIYDNFATPATTGILMNIILVAFAFVAAKQGSMVLLAVGAVAAKGLQYVFFPRAMRKTGYRHAWVLNPKDPFIREALLIALPAIFSILVNDLSVIIDKSIASAIVSEGGVSAMDYAAKLIDFVQGIVVVSIVTASYPRMSRLGQDRAMRPRFKRLTQRAVSSGALLVIPSVVGLMLFATPITRIFFERGAFTPESTTMVSTILFWYAPSLLFILFSQVYTRAFYSLKDTRTPLIAGAIQVGVDIVLNFVLSYFFGLSGLAASTTIGAIAGSLLLMTLLRKKIGPLGLSRMGKSLVKILLATLVMGLASWSVYHFLPLASDNLRFFLALLVAILTYLVVVIALRIPEAQHLALRAIERLEARFPEK